MRFFFFFLSFQPSSSILLFASFTHYFLNTKDVFGLREKWKEVDDVGISRIILTLMVVWWQRKDEESD